MSSWISKGSIQLQEKENTVGKTSTGSSFSWRGKKISILQVTSDASKNINSTAVTNPFKARTKHQTTTASISKCISTTSSNIHDDTNPQPEDDLNIFDDGDMSVAPDTDNTTNTTKNTTLTTNATTHQIPPLVQSEEPLIPSKFSSTTTTATTTATTIKKKKKKMAVSFSDDMNETRTFKRSEEDDKNKLWYSQDEAKQQRDAARHETRDITRIGLCESGTQTSPMVNNDKYNSRNGTMSMSRKQVGQIKGRVTTGKSHWRKGQRINKIELHKQVAMPNDPVYQEIKKIGYRDDGTGRYRTVTKKAEAGAALRRRVKR